MTDYPQIVFTEVNLQALRLTIRARDSMPDGDNALKLLNEAITLNPALVRAYTLRASIYEKKQLFALAVEDYVTISYLDCQDSAHLLTCGSNIARIVYDKSASQIASKRLTELIAIEKQIYTKSQNTRSYGYWELALCYHSQGDYKNACHCLANGGYYSDEQKVFAREYIAKYEKSSGPTWYM